MNIPTHYLLLLLSYLNSLHYVTSFAPLYHLNTNKLTSSSCYTGGGSVRLLELTTDTRSHLPTPLSPSSAIAAASSNEDNSIEKYSRCLTPRQERDQINEELGLKVDSRWKKVAKKPFKMIGKTIQRSLEGRKSPGTLILVRGGESEFSKNFTFTGWSDPPLTSQGELEVGCLCCTVL